MFGPNSLKKWLTPYYSRNGATVVVIPGMAAIARKHAAIIANPVSCSRRCPIQSSRAMARK